MEAKAPLSSPPFQLDLQTEQLWQGSQLIPLRPTTFAVLRYLVEHPNRMVSKDELLEAIWPDTYITEAQIKGRMPLGRLAQPGDVADAVTFLLSEKASFITGQSLYVDGGWLAYGYF